MLLNIAFKMSWTELHFNLPGKKSYHDVTAVSKGLLQLLKSYEAFSPYVLKKQFGLDQFRLNHS